MRTDHIVQSGPNKSEGVSPRVKPEQTGVAINKKENGLGLSEEEMDNLANSQYNTLFDGLPKKRRSNEVVTVRKTITTIVEDPKPLERTAEIAPTGPQTHLNLEKGTTAVRSEETSERVAERKPNLVLSNVENLQESQMKVDYERNLLQKEQRIASLESQLIESRKQNEQMQ